MKSKNLFLMIGLGLFALACGQSSTVSDGGVTNATAAEFKTAIESGEGQLIDIRTPAEYAQGHIEGAALINFYDANFKEEVASLDKDKPVYVYCRSGNRSSKSVSILKEAGFRDIVNLKNGIIDWQRNGFRLVTD